MQSIPTPPDFPKTESSEQVTTLAARLRVSEERNSEMRKKIILIEQNMLSNHKRAMSEIKSLQTELSELKRTVQAAEDKIITIIKELRLTSRKEDIEVLRKYIELWDPVRFVSRETVEKIVEEKLKAKQDE